MITESFLRGKETTAFVTGEFTDLPVFCDLMPKAVMLSREPFRAAEGAQERRPGFGFMRFHVHL